MAGRQRGHVHAFGPCQHGTQQAHGRVVVAPCGGFGADGQAQGMGRRVARLLESGGVAGPVELDRAALAEGLAFAESLQLDAKLTLEVFRRSMAYSRIMDTKGEKMIDKDFRPQGRLSQHLKDVHLIRSESSIRLPLTEAHQQLLERAQLLGQGDMDNSAVILAYGERPQE